MLESLVALCFPWREGAFGEGENLEFSLYTPSVQIVLWHIIDAHEIHVQAYSSFTM